MAGRLTRQLQQLPAAFCPNLTASSTISWKMYLHALDRRPVAKRRSAA